MPKLTSRTRQAVLGYLQHTEGASRAEMARALGYAASTMTTVVSGMIDEGRLEEYVVHDRHRPAGRPAARIRIRLVGSLLAIEFDHDRVRLGVADRDGVIVHSSDRMVDTAASPVNAIRAAADLSHEVIAATPLELTDILAIGVGLPGPVNTVTHTVGSSSVLPNWRDTNVAILFRRYFGDFPLWVDNDANLAALGERTRGLAQDVDTFIYVKASTGVGGCLYLGGEQVRGRYGAAGELGHIAVPGERTLCRCGNRGCLETVSSIPALLRQVANAYPDATDLTAVRGLHEKGNNAIGLALFDMGANLGVHLAHLCTALDIDHIIVGGELTAIGTGYIEGARETTQRWVHPALAETIRVDSSTLGNFGGLIGAAIAARRLAVAGC